MSCIKLIAGTLLVFDKISVLSFIVIRYNKRRLTIFMIISKRCHQFLSNIPGKFYFYSNAKLQKFCIDPTTETIQEENKSI